MANDIFNFIKNNKIATLCIIVAIILIIVLILLYFIMYLFNNSNESDNNMVVYQYNNLPTSDKSINYKTNLKTETQTNNKILTKKINYNIDREISTAPYDSFSMSFLNKGPSLLFNDFYYGTTDRSCGSVIDLNPYIKKTPYEQSITIDNKMLNELINNRCKENKFLYLTGSVQGEEFI